MQIQSLPVDNSYARLSNAAHMAVVTNNATLQRQVRPFRGAIVDKARRQEEHCCYKTEFSNYSQDDNSYPYAAAIMCNFATRGKDISRQKVIPDFENIKKFRSHVCFDFLSTGMW